MSDIFKVKVKDLKRTFYRLRGRFLKLQRGILTEVLIDAAQPIVQAARANAPVLRSRLRDRIQAVPMRSRRGLVNVGVGPVRLSKGDKEFPYYGLFLERGWRATGRSQRLIAGRFVPLDPIGRFVSSRRPAGRQPGRLIPGRHFLRRAGEQNFSRVERIFAEKIFKRFEEIREAGESAGLL